MKALFTASLAMAVLLGVGNASAKLPPPSAEAKAIAAEAAAKAAYGSKVAAYQLCKTQDKVAAAYFASTKKADADVKPALPTPPCIDPGPFVYTPQEPKPLEAAGAHSPPATATAPPSSNQPQAETQTKAAGKP